VVCQSMDRLARDRDHLRKIILSLAEHGIHVRFVNEDLTFSAHDLGLVTLLLNAMKAASQFERDLFGERQREGTLISRLEGREYPGRRRKLTPEKASELCRLAAQGYSKSMLIRLFGVSRQAVYRYLKEGETGGRTY